MAGPFVLRSEFSEALKPPSAFFSLSKILFTKETKKDAARPEERKENPDQVRHMIPRDHVKKMPAADQIECCRKYDGYFFKKPVQTEQGQFAFLPPKGGITPLKGGDQIRHVDF